MHHNLLEILASVDEIEAVDAMRREAFDMAVGVFTNDAVDAEVGVLVWRGKVAQIQIADRFCQRDLATVDAMLNVAIIQAYEAWYRDYLTHLNRNGTADARQV
ncbi:hypothetical protein B5P44_00235 [Mycobacterium sp. CBMA 213]|uniref:Uncharacterized protein n=1 Tax=Mycolicibacterium sp. CBMA 213 TaxID=1968788 RepID=A0A343VR25_9MYCO|nr:MULTISPECIES: hypothetical protein [unclassified Mycolicibacterium]AVN58349.1 hypothetical protein B5P44_p00054 [Mycolicibacterium sp. CBMA 213]MUL61013.1 hypothetical protein [Mycolicibacterium sp. CBMA 335]MUM03250.1 hypothetical protein [Mycolicibacterium sp. CBMA 213]